MFDLNLDSGSSSGFNLTLFGGGGAPPTIAWGKIKISGTFIDVVNLSVKTSGVFTDAAGYKIKVAGTFIDLT